MGILIDGQEALTMSESAEYVQLTDPALRNRIARYNQIHPQTPIHRYRSEGGRERYIKKSDLDKLRVLQPIPE